MTRQFAGNTGRALSILVEIVDGADIIQTTASDIIAAWGIGASHDPAGPQGDGVDLVSGVGIPNDELAILGGRNEVAAIGSPVHGVDLGKVAAESATGTHDDTGQGGNFVGHSSDCVTPAKSGVRIRKRMVLTGSIS